MCIERSTLMSVLTADWAEGAICVVNLPFKLPDFPMKEKWKWINYTRPTPWGPMDCSLPGSSVYGILQTRILEWIAIFFSRVNFWPRDQIWVSCIAISFFSIGATREAWGSYISAYSKSLHVHLMQFVHLLYVCIVSTVSLKKFFSL